MNRILHIIRKSLKEQLRSLKVLALTLVMGPFFILVYYLIIDSTKISYDILVIQDDQGIDIQGDKINLGDSLLQFFADQCQDNAQFPIKVQMEDSLTEGILLLEKNKADAMLVIPADFSASLMSGNRMQLPDFELRGDLSRPEYLLSAVIINELVQSFLLGFHQETPLFTYREIPLGNSASMDDFSLMVPGIMILSVIMLMFTASIAFVSEVENKTIMRLKISYLKPFEYLIGVSVVQLLLGVISVFVTFYTALALGYEPVGDIILILLPAFLASLSIVGFSLIIAAYTRSASEVLVVGNFPMFLFMFFTGAAFPMEGVKLFEIGTYTFTLQGLMSPTHAISALHKLQNLGLPFSSIYPEMLSLLLLSLLYFLLGAWLFRRQHLKSSKL